MRKLGDPGPGPPGTATKSHDVHRAAARNYIASRHLVSIFVLLTCASCAGDGPRRDLRPQSIDLAPGQLVERATSSDLNAIAFAEGGTVGWSVGDLGVILRSTDGGATWSELAPKPTRTDLHAIMALDRNVAITAGANGLILRTSDGGDHWEQVHPLTSTDSRQPFYGLAAGVGAKVLWAVGEAGTILESINGGRTWKHVESGLSSPARLQTACFNKTGDGFAAGDSGTIIQRSADGRWTSSRVSDVAITSIAFEENGRNGWIGGEFGLMGSTTDGGSHWTVGMSDLTVTTHAIDATGRRMYGSDAQGILVAPIQGISQDSWKTAGMRVVSLARIESVVRSVTFDRASGREWAAGALGFLWSAGTSTPWSRSLPIVELPQALAATPEGTAIWIGGEEGVVAGTRDGGLTWPLKGRVPSGDPIRILRVAGSKLWALTSRHLEVSEDDGRTWSTFWTTSENLPLSALAVSWDGETILVGGRNVLVDLSIGASQPAVQVMPHQVTSIELSGDGSVAIVAASKLLRRTRVDGVWRDVSGLPSDWTRAYIALSRDGRTAWCAVNDGRVFRSEDGGESWREVYRPGVSANLRAIAMRGDGKTGLAVGDHGNIIRSVDGGVTWFKVANGLTQDVLLDTVVVDQLGEWVVSSKGGLLAVHPGAAPPSLLHFSVKPGPQRTLIANPVIDPGRVDASKVRGIIELSGDSVIDAARDTLRRSFTGDAQRNIEPWREDILLGRTCVVKVSLCDDWNIVPYEFSFRFGPSRSEQLAKMLHWPPADAEELFQKTLPLTLTVVGVLYYALIASIFLIRPAAFVAWHETLAGALPLWSSRLVAFLAPLMVRSDRCIDAFVRQHAAVAERKLEQHPGARSHASWVPSALKIGDDLYESFARPVQLPTGVPYVAGLMELRPHLSSDRQILSVQGPGGVGKSALAFQIARWALDARPTHRLAQHRMLPILIDSIEAELDDLVIDKLKYALDIRAISSALGDALLEKKRILALIDGLSELKREDGSQLDPVAGARRTRALIITTRIPTRLAGEVILVPQPIGLKDLDRILDALITERVGYDRISGEERERIRERFKFLLRSSESVGDELVPMLFLKLLVDRAAVLLQRGESFDNLPASFVTLIDEYVAELLLHDWELMKAARRAALAAITPGFVPHWTPQTVVLRDVTSDQLEKLLVSGLLERSGLAIDPQFKFSLDPVSEFLAAVEILSLFRDGRLDDELALALRPRGFSELPPAFRSALRLCAAHLHMEIPQPDE